jgi:hypothetical protein
VARVAGNERGGCDPDDRGKQGGQTGSEGDERANEPTGEEPENGCSGSLLHGPRMLAARRTINDPFGGVRPFGSPSAMTPRTTRKVK